MNHGHRQRPEVGSRRRIQGTVRARRGGGLESRLTDGAVGAAVARAGAVTLVVLKAKADTDPLVLTRKVATRVHCG